MIVEAMPILASGITELLKYFADKVVDEAKNLLGIAPLVAS